MTVLLSVQEANNKSKDDLVVASENIKALQESVEHVQEQCKELDGIIAEKLKKRLAVRLSLILVIVILKEFICVNEFQGADLRNTL